MFQITIHPVLIFIMHESFETRRRAVVRLIQQLGKPDRGFSVGEVCTMFREQMGHCILDGQETIPDYIQGLTDFGILQYRDGIYFVTQ